MSLQNYTGRFGEQKDLSQLPCIEEQFLIPDYNQQDARFLDLFISTDKLQVSSGSSAHHQEHITVYTSGIVNQYYC
jgi:hypothetical protein